MVGFFVGTCDGTTTGYGVGVISISAGDTVNMADHFLSPILHVTVAVPSPFAKKADAAVLYHCTYFELLLTDLLSALSSVNTSITSGSDDSQTAIAVGEKFSSNTGENTPSSNSATSPVLYSFRMSFIGKRLLISETVPVSILRTEKSPVSTFQRLITIKRPSSDSA